MPHPLGDLAAKARRPRATGKKDGRKTLTLNRRSVARPCGAMSRGSGSAYHHSTSPREVLWSRIPLPSNYLQATGGFMEALTRFEAMEC